MDGSAPALIYMVETPAFLNHITSIDHEAELFYSPLAENDTQYKGTLADLSKDRPQTEIDNEVKNNFKFLTGNEPIGKVSS